MHTESKDIFATLDRLHALLKNLPEVDQATDATTAVDRFTYLGALQRYQAKMAEETPELND